MAGQIGAVYRPAIERFMEKIRPGANGCIEWIGGLNGVGYGQFYEGRTNLDQTGKTYAHRWSYEHFVGPIPDGMHLDHLCRNRRCVNPQHLEPVTCRENLLRGTGASARNAIKTHCPAGHPYEGDNLYFHPIRKQRICRACGRLRAQRYRQIKKTKNGE